MAMFITSKPYVVTGPGFAAEFAFLDSANRFIAQKGSGTIWDGSDVPNYHDNGAFSLRNGATPRKIVRAQLPYPDTFA